MSTSIVSQSLERTVSAPRRAPALASRRDDAYPLSQFYLRPLAAWVAHYLAPTAIRPEQVTLAGACAALVAAIVLVTSLAPTSLVAAFVLLAWFCDRLDGELARRQGTNSAWGAWLDANLDELADVGLHTAIAWAAATRLGSTWPWGLLLAFVAGKYLFMYGLSTEKDSGLAEAGSLKAQIQASQRPAKETPGGMRHLLSDLYHLPANADVRAHVLVLALAWNALAFELAWVALYYNLRWIARYVLVARRLRGAAQ